MSKNIVICSDGTGNSAVKGRGTNVFKLFEAVDFQEHRQDPSLLPQIAFYDDGVGTDRLKPLKILGGAFGWGLSRNVKDLYLELARVYDPGDRIFLFGFSRGAFTVRTLAGLISQIGVVDRDRVASDVALKRLVQEAYKEHRRCYRRIGSLPRSEEDEKHAEQFRFRHSVRHDMHAPAGKVSVEFMGVWDTVDAFGFPLDEIADLWNKVVYPFKFPDTFLSPLVKRAAHAIAIDDERYTFHPVMWNESKETTDRIQQVWFAGVHSNVGGGYSKQGMSLVALLWMMEQAEKSELRFVPSVRQMYSELQNVNDKLYDSRSGLASYYRYRPRSIGEICRKNGVKPRIHVSAVERIAVGSDGYAPGNLSEDVEVVSERHPPVGASLTAAVRSALRDGRPLVEHARRWVLMKEGCQRGFAVGSWLAALYVAWQLGIEGVARVFSIAGLVSVLKILSEVPWVSVVLLVLLSLSFWCSGQIRQTYSELWFPVRHRLRDWLHGMARGAGQS